MVSSLLKNLRVCNKQGRTLIGSALLRYDVTVHFPVDQSWRQISTGDIDPQVTTQMGVFVFAFEVSFTRINVAFFSLFVGFNVIMCISHVWAPFGFSIFCLT